MYVQIAASVAERENSRDVIFFFRTFDKKRKKIEEFDCPIASKANENISRIKN